MIKSSEFQIINIQAVVYASDSLSLPASKTLALILGKFSDRYDGAVQSLVMEDHIPSEFPRVIVQSKNQEYGVQVAATRISSVWKRADNGEKSHKDLVDSCAEVLKFFVQETNLQVGRIALVFTNIKQDDRPALSLIDWFCKPEFKDGLFSQSKDFEIHKYNRCELDEFSVNNWMRFKTGQYDIEGEEKSAITVEQDINTLGDDIKERNFSIEDIEKFCESATNSHDLSLTTFFPG